MKVLVLNPITKITKNIVRDVLYGCWCKGKRIGGGTVPPYSLLSVATFLKNNNIDVSFLDAQALQLDIDVLIKQISKYDIVIISTSTMSFNEDVELLSIFKRLNQKIKTIILGSHPTFMPEHALSKKQVDFIIIGEPELSILKLIEHLINKKEYANLKGIGFRRTSESTQINQIDYIQNLDELSPLDVNFLPKDIHYFNPIVKRMPYITTTTSRGCPGKCTFCTAPLFYGPKIRFKSDDKVIEELKYYVENGIKEVYFRDETFIIRKRRDKEFCKKLIKEKLDLTWLCNCRVGMVTKEDMYYMKEAKCHLIKFGVESGEQKILDNVKKGIKVEQTKETFNWAKEIGIDTHAHIMLGMPGETEETIEKTIQFALEIAPTTVTFGICSPYPGSVLYNDLVVKYPEIFAGGDISLTNLHTQALYNEYFTEVSSKTIEKAIRRAYKKFYLRPSYFIKTLKRFKNLRDIKRFSLAGTKIIDFILRGD